MGDENEPLSHGDMWDDSVLVDSWNEALEEYKKYHSIHAKGLTLDEASLETIPADTEPKAHEEQGAGEPSEAIQETELRNVSSGVVSERGGLPDREASGPAPMPTPQGLLSTVQDEGLKRLLMSWYYAGYYTGLHEGQQKGKESSS